MATLPSHRLQPTHEVTEKVDTMGQDPQASSSILEWPNEAGVSHLRPGISILPNIISSKLSTNNTNLSLYLSSAPSPRTQQEFYIAPDRRVTKPTTFPAPTGSMALDRRIGLKL
jgi:hypothetical protein